MAQRKLQQEIDKCFKRVAEGVQAFEATFEKIQQATNSSQKDKLEDALKREIKKLQRNRDQIKTWAASNEIKDKKPLIDQRKLIETQMEKFKAVEKEMKTKAYSKEGLSAAAKQDPKEKEKEEMCSFLATMNDELGRQVETVEAEAVGLQANLKKGKKDTSKAERVAELERTVERHKWHQAKLELIKRLLENGGLETDQVADLQEGIRYYVESNQEPDFMEDDAIYDELHLQDEEDAFGGANELDRVSSQDAQSIQDDGQEGAGGTAERGKSKSGASAEGVGGTGRRPSTQMRSPLPTLATLHTPGMVHTTTGPTGTMKPAPPPSRPAGETLKYASAAAAAAAAGGDKNGVGIAPLPPPPGAAAQTAIGGGGVLPGLTPLPPVGGVARAGPSTTTATVTSPRQEKAQPVASAVDEPRPAAAPSAPAVTEKSNNERRKATKVQTEVGKPTTTGSAVDQSPDERPGSSSSHAPNGTSAANITSTTTPSTNDISSGPIIPANNNHAGTQPSPSSQQQQQPITSQPLVEEPEPDFSSEASEPEDQESIYHLPLGLQDLVQSFETTKNRVRSNFDTTTTTNATTNGHSHGPNHSSFAHDPTTQRLLSLSYATRPDSIDADRPRTYRPQTLYPSPTYYPQDPLPVFEDARLYSRVDTDTLFFVFYYRQNTLQQYFAAKSLKSQSWRFHKQYQTWFQRHEEPQSITEEYEQGTYRFFDYESTWMNRRKTDFRFAYKFLEDDM
ncbi:MAG: hypothetical protein M1823_002249 [Watsoniomyces obsoletus]|nr:MAG: hypothetical protein M1823_002249 [Watsoniomyces obsoletus]